ncbi:hypothetical protein VTK73DRAFT_10120 [Phialemonium thermophilum]|uniref:Uncharacterized protein n=1 Tax=Phialemonium thermophilum TaxID=223376 RepID=A0ABR3XI00_9PEZI
MASGEEGHYQPKDAVSTAAKGALVTGGAGLFVAAIQNARQKRNVGAWSVLTRGGGTIATFAAVGGVYDFSRIAAANLREKDDHYNSAIGGFLAGAILGLRTGRMPAVLGWGAVTATVLAIYEYSAAGLKRVKDQTELGMDEFERKEYLRKNRRRPIEETLAEVGEGRSIKPPGYEERRRQRLKEKYGVEISPVCADPNA